MTDGSGQSGRDREEADDAWSFLSWIVTVVVLLVIIGLRQTTGLGYPMSLAIAGVAGLGIGLVGRFLHR